MCKQPVITWGEIWTVGWRMYQHLPEPTLHQTLHIMMAMKCCTVLEQNDTMFKQFWLFTANSQPHLILQECASNMATDCHRSSMSPFQLKNMTAWLSEQLDCTVQFSSQVFLGTPFSTVFAAECQMNASMTCQPLKCDKICIVFISPML